ncbi:cell division protein SepF [Bifidobacterium mongoliense]|uniref:Cell division protein SepF n=2 Tax=Bifidobacterium mongoliense TaxID=518643 RepID=A0A087BUU8_9BIFI|nr:cell division protein SepF [Bifidobacterium mongoliense]KFI74798.1 cell division protein SepF [Bifidobacterium mongoliense DSM 21395]MDN5632880.1 cell division protein SepF [Bifidobacterium mongoliense]MDN5978893.1 cell division protein SepF [Bifidobacterium mongoliense]MDN6024671.1 cell division protein SepF [Bifidobacterium mongoliense]MDN6051260.1 cell division protein SepF [Bifidobacterium mongoliense]
MAGFMKNAMSYLGMSDVVDEDAEMGDEAGETSTSFDSDHTVTPMAAASGSTPSSSAPRESTPFPNRISRITTIHPKSYEDAQLVGRAIRDGVPVVLNLTGVSEAVAYRIVDFSAGVVFGVRGSIERVTPRVFLLSPAQVNIKIEEPPAADSARDLFS